MRPSFDCATPTLGRLTFEAPATPARISAAAAMTSAIFDFMSCPFVSRLRAEVDVGRAAADLLDPDVLDAVDVRREVVVGDDHLHALEGRVVPVAGAVEVGQEDRRVRVGHRRLAGLGRGAGALEGRALQEAVGVPADALPAEAALERPLSDVGETA